MQRTFRRSDGFTLPELLTLIVALVLLLAVAAVAQPGFVDSPIARVINCRNRLSELGRAMALYAADWKNTFAGPNTSGAEGQFQSGSNLTGNRTGATPVSTHDWFSPTVGRVMELPVNRAGRTQFITNSFACPDTTVNNGALFGQAPDIADFQQRFQAGGFRQISYLSPSSFHYFGSTTAANANRYRGITLKSSAGTPVRVSDSYRPRLDLVGAQPASKVYLADGTRFLSQGVLDMDISPNPTVNGSFLDPGPIVQASTAYGRGNAESPANTVLSFRHRRIGASGAMNIAYFDGHVDGLMQTQAYTNAAAWYPGGSVFGGSGATPESIGNHASGSILP